MLFRVETYHQCKVADVEVVEGGGGGQEEQGAGADEEQGQEKKQNVHVSV